MSRRYLVSLAVALLTLICLLAGLLSASQSLVLQVDAPRAPQYLANFRDLERNPTTAYRWSFSQAALNAHAFARVPLIVDLRLTSPRPAAEPAADLAIARGRWRTQAFAIRGDWRRYSVLLPASAYQPELTLIATMFRPDERDQRSLGVALSRVRLAVPSTQPDLLITLQMLGLWRVAVLGSLPLAIYLLFSGLGRRQFGQQGQVLGLVGACASLGLVYWQASNPINAAFYPAEAWLPLLFAGIFTVVWFAQRGYLRGIEQRVVAVLDSDRTRPWVTLGVGLILGGAMVAAMPPWEHPDESSHFEFAWLIANHPTWPIPGTSDPRLAEINGGGRALYHQPLYHATLSLLLRLISELPLVSQLYLARCFSLLLFLLILFFAERTSREVFEYGHPLRWLAPLAVALNPTIANLMTGVNNDVASAAVCSWAIWGASRVLATGLTWWRFAWLVTAIPLAMFCKNTGAALLGIVPLVLIAAIWQQRGWRWRWLFLAGTITAVATLVLMLRWSDPTHWYRWGKSTQQAALRIERPEAPVGPHVLRLYAESIRDYEGLSSPVAPDVRLAGQTVTVGAWVWASRPAHIWSPGVITQVREEPLSAGFNLIGVDTTPQFVAFQYNIPERLMFAHMMAWSVVPEDPQPLEIYVDGMVMAEGIYPAHSPPQFANAGTQHGVWGGIPFTNLIRNGDVEQGWVYLHPTADRLISRFARRSFSRLVASGADIGTTAYLEFRDYLPWMTFTSFGAYGGRIFLRDPGWQMVLPAMALLITCGVALGLWRLRQQAARRQYVLLVLGLICFGVWGTILIAHLPVNFPVGLPSVRYGFIVIIPTTIGYCAGWLALWPASRKRQAAFFLLALLVLLSIAALTTIRLFDNTACVFDPVRCAFTPTRPAFFSFFE